MSRRYSAEFHEFMREYIPGHTAVEISNEASRRFGIIISPSAVKSYKQNRKIKSGTPLGRKKNTPTELFPKEVFDFLNDNHIGIGPKEMTTILNNNFGTSYSISQIRGYYKNHRLNSGVTGQFKKGNVPANKGKKVDSIHPNSVATQFKKRHIPKNKLPIGTVMMKSDGYLWRKVGEGARDWKQEHRIVWEQVYGPIPYNEVLIFKDGDRRNVAIDNLTLVTKAELLELTQKHLRSTDKKLTETGILIARLNCKLNNKKKTS